MCMLWIQNMPSMIYYSMQMSFGWNGLSMATKGCSVCMPIAIIYFKVRVLNRTLSHIWWRVYLPTFLLSEGLLTLIYIDSLIVLARPYKCNDFIYKVSKFRFIKIRVIQVNKFNRFLGNKDKDLGATPLANNNQSQAKSNSNKWVVNLSSTPCLNPLSLFLSKGPS